MEDKTNRRIAAALESIDKSLKTLVKIQRFTFEEIKKANDIDPLALINTALEDIEGENRVESDNEEGGESVDQGEEDLSVDEWLRLREEGKIR